MPRRANIDPPTRLELKLPESVRTKLDLLLYSELEKRVPQGRYQAFFLDRLTEFFEWKRLELTPYGFPAGMIILAPRETIEALVQVLPARSQNGQN